MRLDVNAGAFLDPPGPLPRCLGAAMYRSALAAVGAVNFLLYASAPLRPCRMSYI